LSILPPISANEDQMLDFTAMERVSNSRLSCQLIMTPELDGLTYGVANPQLEGQTALLSYFDAPSLLHTSELEGFM